jgi:hypothetical protein
MSVALNEAMGPLRASRSYSLQRVWGSIDGEFTIVLLSFQLGLDVLYKLKFSFFHWHQNVYSGIYSIVLVLTKGHHVFFLIVFK